jgi:hypothetical protein
MNTAAKEIYARNARDVTWKCGPRQMKNGTTVATAPPTTHRIAIRMMRCFRNGGKEPTESIVSERE